MIKAISTYVAAAALSVGGVAFMGCDRDDDAVTTETTTTTTTNPDVAVNTDADTSDAQPAAANDVGPGVEEVRDTFAKVTEASLTKDGFDDIVERFVDADRNRFGEAMPKDDALTTLNGRIADIQKNWKAKYNDEIDIEDEAKVFPASFMAIATGELGKNAAGVDVDVDRDADSLEVDVDRKTGVDAPGSPSADTNRNDPGRNVASVKIQASHGLPALQVPVIHEAGGWRIDVPDTLTAQKFHDLLLAHLTHFGEMQGQWPATQEEGYRALTHHVLMAVMGKEVQK